MDILICPVCQNILYHDKNRFWCQNSHSFDVSKKGYVNLLMSNSSGDKRHGDDKAMAIARTNFLNGGYYFPLVKEISQIAERTPEQSPVIFECGCGECYYISNLYNSLKSQGKIPVAYGGDISKDVLPFGKKRSENITLFVASAYKLPIMSDSVDIALSIFAPMDHLEMGRIVKQGGSIIKVIPLEKHLIELKEELYSEVYLNRPVIENIDFFETVDFKKIEYSFYLDSPQKIDCLFKMTPYYYKTSVEAQKKILKLNSLRVTASFGILHYVKQ